MTIKKTLKQQLHEELFKELASIITIGFGDQDLEPLTMDEQLAFFMRQDVKEHIEKIIDDIEQFMIEENEKMPIPGDAYRESIYDGEYALYEKIIVPIENERKAINGDLYELKDSDILTYEKYMTYQ